MLILITAAEPVRDIDTEEITGYDLEVQTQRTVDGKLVTLLFTFFLNQGELLNHRPVIEKRILDALLVADPHEIIGDEWRMEDEKKGQALSA
jgi:hypothetical protein